MKREIIRIKSIHDKQPSDTDYIIESMVKEGRDLDTIYQRSIDLGLDLALEDIKDIVEEVNKKTKRDIKMEKSINRQAKNEKGYKVYVYGSIDYYGKRMFLNNNFTTTFIPTEAKIYNDYSKAISHARRRAKIDGRDWRVLDL